MSDLCGLKQRERLEKIQSHFLKQVLSVSMCTLNYLIRLETAVTGMECLLIGRALNYYAKIQGVEENRFSKICLEKLEFGLKSKQSEEVGLVYTIEK